MYERFISAFPPNPLEVVRPYTDSQLEAVEGFRALTNLGAGVSFGDGIVHIHSEDEMLRARELIEEEFPEYGGIVRPIAKDWLGRQVAALFSSPAGSFSQLLLIEPGSGEAFQIDCGLVELFDVELEADPVTYLASDLFEQWRGTGVGVPAGGQCVGFKVPLFLGGAGSVDNLEIVDEQVYWSLCGQLRAKVNGRPPGTSFGGVGIE